MVSTRANGMPSPAPSAGVMTSNSGATTSSASATASSASSTTSSAGVTTSTNSASQPRTTATRSNIRPRQTARISVTGPPAYHNHHYAPFSRHPPHHHHHPPNNQNIQRVTRNSAVSRAMARANTPVGFSEVIANIRRINETMWSQNNVDHNTTSSAVGDTSAAAPPTTADASTATPGANQGSARNVITSSAMAARILQQEFFQLHENTPNQSNTDNNNTSVPERAGDEDISLISVEMPNTGDNNLLDPG